MKKKAYDSKFQVTVSCIKYNSFVPCVMIKVGLCIYTKINVRSRKP